MARIPRRAYQAALTRARGWLRRKDVLAVGLGLRNRSGQFIEDEICVVVTVRWKRSLERLAERGEKPLPREIVVRAGAKQYKIPVDLEGARGRLAGRLHGIVAAPMRAANLSGEGARLGVVGAVVAQNGIPLILAAGHVVVKEGVRVTIHTPGGSLAGTATSVFFDGNLDHALVELDDELPSNASSLPTGDKLVGVRDSSGVLPNEDMFFYSRAGDLRNVRVVKVDAIAPFKTPNGTRNFQHLIAVKGDTEKGDSGTLLFDDQFRAAATLVGEYLGLDYFLPCDLSFDQIGVVLT